MPSKMRPLYELNVDGTNRIRRNEYFSNYSLCLSNDLDSMKVIYLLLDLKAYVCVNAFFFLVYFSSRLKNKQDPEECIPKPGK